MENIIEELQADPYPVKSSQRPLRATGVACAVAVGIMEVWFFISYFVVVWRVGIECERVYHPFPLELQRCTRVL